MENIIKVSVIICTRNRAKSLKECLAAFEMMVLRPDITWELIVVDNNSTDNTRDVIQEFSERAPVTVKYVHEIKPGLGHARNAGIELATGEVIAFTDDDCIVTSDWLASMVHEFRSDPTISGVGGRVELYDIRDKPITINTSLKRGLLSSIGQVFGYIPGCNMAFKRNVFDQIGNYDGRFGAGAIFKSAEDSDFTYRAYKNGFKIIYSPEMCVYHNHGRRTDYQVRLLIKGYDSGKWALYCKHIFKGDINILKQAYWEIIAIIRRINDILVGTSSYSLAFFKECITNLVFRQH